MSDGHCARRPRSWRSALTLGAPLRPSVRESSAMRCRASRLSRVISIMYTSIICRLLTSMAAWASCWNEAPEVMRPLAAMAPTSSRLDVASSGAE